MGAFVTGGSGFLGQHLIRTLRAQGVEVRALARSASAVEKVKRAGAQPIPGDLDDLEALRSGMEGCTVVFHAAAKVHDWGSPSDFHRVNVEGTEQVINVARQVASVSRLVHVSTEAVLVGEKPIINVDETRPRPVKPLGLYPQTKAIAEERVLQANSPELTTVVVRPRFIWGKGDTTLLPRIIENIRNGDFAWISGGRYLISTCHVKNVCEGLICAAERGQGGEIYFVTDGSPVEFRSFITQLTHTQGIDPGKRSLPRWLVWALAWSFENGWKILKLNDSPPITQTALCMIGQEVTINDTKARRDLGYTGVVSRQEGLVELACM